MKGAPVFGMAQAVGVLVVGLYAVGTRNVSLVASLCGYLVGCEVLWRQNNVPLPYLSAPYLITALSVFVVIAVLGRMGRDARLAVVYFLLLVPAIVGTVRTAGGNARELIAFALSGPLALTAFVAFTSQMRADLATYRRILWVTLVSLVGPLAIALSDVGSELAASGRIEFTSASNFVTSGGFGPVQVSTVLGLGVLIGVILTIVDRDRTLQVLAGVLAAVFTVQSLLTFSRGGMFATAIALSALAVYRVRERRIRNRVIAVVAVALSLGYFVVVPWLEDFTDGAFGQRFSDVSSSRTELAANDTQLFSENIVFGVGPGMTKYQRLSYEICQLRSDRCKDEASSHTEWTRMLGEHGIPGVLSLVALIVLATRAVRNHRRERPFAIAFVTWAVAQMFYANLRVVAVPFAFGLAFLTLRQLSRAGDDDPDGDVGTDDGPGPPPPVPVVQPAVTPATWTTARATWAAAPAGVAGPRPVRINGTHPPSGNGSATPPPYHGPVP
jgi:O-antigen ligase